MSTFKFAETRSCTPRDFIKSLLCFCSVSPDDAALKWPPSLEARHNENFVSSAGVQTQTDYRITPSNHISFPNECFRAVGGCTDHSTTTSTTTSLDDCTKSKRIQIALHRSTHRRLLTSLTSPDVELYSSLQLCSACALILYIDGKGEISLSLSRWMGLVGIMTCSTKSQGRKSLPPPPFSSAFSPPSSK